MEHTPDESLTTMPHYAQFWQRAFAYIFDWIVINIFNSLVILPVLKIANLTLPPPIDIATAQKKVNTAILNNPNISFSEIMALVGVNVPNYLTIILILAGINCLYYAQMEASPLQGTLGKMMMGLKVADMQGNRISFLKALTRHLAKFLSFITFGIGYIMAAFTEHKQALHDKLAECTVLKK